MAPSTGSSATSSNTVCIRRHRDKRLSVHHMARVSLKDPRDFDRIIGVVLGKRAATNEAIDILLHRMLGDGNGGRSLSHRETARAMMQQIYDCSPWSFRVSSSTSTSSPSLSGTTQPSGRFQQQCFDTEEGDEESWMGGGKNGGFSASRINHSQQSLSQTLLLTLTVSTAAGVASASSSAASRRGTSQTFSFVCPCGPAWGQPSADVSVLAGAVAALPHQPPPSVLRSSVLSSLLLDARSEFVSLCSVRRPVNDMPAYGSSTAVEPAALSTLRIIGQCSR